MALHCQRKVWGHIVTIQSILSAYHRTAYHRLTNSIFQRSHRGVTSAGRAKWRHHVTYFNNVQRITGRVTPLRCTFQRHMPNEEFTKRSGRGVLCTWCTWCTLLLRCVRSWCCHVSGTVRCHCHVCHCPLLLHGLDSIGRRFCTSYRSGMSTGLSRSTINTISPAASV